MNATQRRVLFNFGIGVGTAYLYSKFRKCKPSLAGMLFSGVVTAIVTEVKFKPADTVAPTIAENISAKGTALEETFVEVLGGGVVA